jgi:diguanylate cyclase (GGDEF)-like protein
MQVLVAIGVILVAGALVRSLGAGADAQPPPAHALGLLLIAIATYAWGIFRVIGGVVISLVAWIVLAWAWAIRPTPVLGAEVAACSVLVAAAAVTRRRRLRRMARLAQVVEDLGDEQTANEQALAAAGATREALRKKLSRYTQLQTIAEELSHLTDREAIGQLAVERTFALIGKSDVCLLFLVDADRQELSLFASRRREGVASVRTKHGDQFDRHVLRTHRPLLVNDVRRDFRFTVGTLPERPVSSVIACPLLLEHRPTGVLRLDSPQPNAYTQDDLRFLDILLELVATAVANARLMAQAQQLAMTDGLTGLLLRRPFMEHLSRELARAGRSREPVAVLLLDVDHFKAYNDTFGHTAGDRVLTAVAEVVRQVVPPGGVSARYGGEEFIVLLPRHGRCQAGELAEAIRQLVPRQATRMAAGSHRPSSPALHSGEVSVSIGLAVCPDDGQAELELMRAADQRLYQAKRDGRNLVCTGEDVASGVTPPPGGGDGEARGGPPPARGAASTGVRGPSAAP